MGLENLHNIISYDPKTGYFHWASARRKIKIGDRAGTIGNRGYRVICINRRDYLEHRLAWFYMTGKWPAAQIDHLNMVRDDNRFCNLREATNSQNGQNRKVQSNSKSGLRGVSWSKASKKWNARIKVNGTYLHLGLFDCPASARIAYVIAADKYHGEFARVE